jgi:hypothetical protein
MRRRTVIAKKAVITRAMPFCVISKITIKYRPARVGMLY